MKIELEEPFKSKWKFGYLVVNKEPRRNVILFNTDKDRTTVSYARYLMSVHLERELRKDEHVDHINGDRLDDRLENYQILSPDDNTRKGMKSNNIKKAMVEIECGNCGRIFSKPRNCTHLVIKTKKSTYCSRQCSGRRGNKGQSKIIKEYMLGFWETNEG